MFFFEGNTKNKLYDYLVWEFSKNTFVFLGCCFMCFAGKYEPSATYLNSENLGIYLGSVLVRKVSPLSWDFLTEYTTGIRLPVVTMYFLFSRFHLSLLQRTGEGQDARNTCLQLYFTAIYRRSNFGVYFIFKKLSHNLVVNYLPTQSCFRLYC